VHRTRIIRDEGVAERDDAREQPQVGPPDEIHHAHPGRQRRFYLTRRVAIAAAKALALVTVDLLAEPALLAQARAEFEERQRTGIVKRR